MQVYERTVPTYLLPDVRVFVVKLNKRAAKVGVPALVLAEGTPYLKKVHLGGANNNRETYELCDLVLTMSAPIKFAGYNFIARLNNEGDEVLISAVPGEEVPKHYREPAKTCDHCRKNRMRNAYYLVRDDVGTHLRVGSSCLKDFLGTDASGALFAGDLARKLDDGFEGMDGRGEPQYYPPSVLAVTAAVMREHGWVSKKDSDECKLSTATRVDKQFWRKPDKNCSRVKVTEPDRRMAQQALAWAKERFSGPPAKLIGLSDYDHNLRVVSSLASVKAKQFGLLCSLIPAAQRALNKQAERVAQTVAAPSAHIGKIGERRTFAGKVVGINTFNSEWGATHYFKVATSDGLVVVKSSKVWWADDIDRGSEVKFLATIKKHGEFRDGLETTVNRAVKQ